MQTLSDFLKADDASSGEYLNRGYSFFEERSSRLDKVTEIAREVLVGN